MNTFILTLKTYKLNVEIHKHSAYQIVISDDNPFTSTIDNDLNTNIVGFVIKPHIPHLCKADDSTLNVVNIEPYSAVGVNLASRFLNDKNYIVFKSHKEINTFFEIEGDNFDIFVLIRTIIDSTKNSNLDERILKIIDHIKTFYNQQDITAKTLAELTFLSPSRLASLFRVC